MVAQKLIKEVRKMKNENSHPAEWWETDKKDKEAASWALDTREVYEADADLAERANSYLKNWGDIRW